MEQKKKSGPKVGSKGTAGPGRPSGSTNKISGVSIINAIAAEVGVPYEKQLATNYKTAITNNDRVLVAKYDQMFLGKVVADVSAVDITSNGESLVPVTVTLNSKELDDFKKR